MHCDIFEIPFADCQGKFFPECQQRIRSESKEVGIIQCWGKPLYAYCKARDGTVFHIPGFDCKHSTCPTDAKAQKSTAGKKKLNTKTSQFKNFHQFHI